MLNIVLFGPPGAGKGTQSAKLIEKFNLVHIATGDLFRKHLSEGTELGKLAQSYMSEGNLVPDKVVIDMVDDKIKDHADAAGIIFDGFPRTVAQAEALDALMASKETPILGMLALQVPEKELIGRLLERGKTSGRADDQNLEKIKNRLNVYQNETVPVAEYYQTQEKFQPIEGVGEIDDIFNSLCEALEELS